MRTLPFPTRTAGARAPALQASRALPRRRWQQHAALAWLCAAATHTSAQADMAQLPLEQLMQMEVTTASRYAQTALEAPAVVSVVTAEDIRLFGYRTLAEVLGSMRGLYVSYDRSYHYLGNRGFATPGDYNTRVLLLVNGVRFNDNLYDQATIGTDFPLDLDLVERVEFVPGPGSAVYGANAFFGVVNVITRDGRQLPGPQVSVEAGSHGSAKGRFSLGGMDDHGGDWLVALTRSSSRGTDQYYAAYDTPENNHGVAQRLDYDRSTQLFARMRRDGLSLTLAHSERVKGTPTAAFSQTFNDPRSRMIDTTTRLAAEITRELQPSLSFTGRLHAGRYRFDGDYVYDYPPLTLNRDVGAGQWWGTELQWISTAIARHKLAWGVDYRRDTGIRQLNFDVEPAAQYLDSRRTGSAVGLYVQDEFALAPTLTLHTGVRWGKQSGSAGSVHPRLGLVYWWNPSTVLKLLHGTAYRPPNAYERDYAVDLPGGILSTPGLRPEKVRTTEIALEHAPTGTTRMLVTAFRSQVTDLLSLGDAAAPDRLVFSSARGVQVHGVEAEVEQRWQRGARLRLAWGWQHARDANASAPPLTNAPRQLLKLQWSDTLRLGAAGPGQPAQYAVEAIGVAARETLSHARLPGYIVTNLVYSRRIADVDLSLGVYNLFNRRYADPASYEIREDAIRQDGRTYRLKLTYAF
ncbi:TonB-dependent receptor plug domain-containing protein [Acidovorax sp. M2(2025)]|uniref:TonB-dependent receptor plug domain-containing protein n=1 Tax=Acidovorax sp. M2(2025) TaxID=3411355 RepID=UPI003BF5EAA6